MSEGGLRELALFAGAGGGILGGKLLGWRTVCAVEIDAYARSVLLARQRDVCLEPFPIWDDVETFDGHPWRGFVDVVSGGFPCQDISAAGRGAGIRGDRSGLWAEFARIIGEVQPRFAFVENSPMLTVRGLGDVLGDLAALGYDARWGVLGAYDAGAPHKRERVWIVAHADDNGPQDQRGATVQRQPEQPTVGGGGSLADANIQGPQGGLFGGIAGKELPLAPAGCGEGGALADTSSLRPSGSGLHWFWGDPAEAGEGEADHAFAERIRNQWGIESRLDRVAHGVANRVDRLAAIGNGQVPSVARLAWEILAP